MLSVALGFTILWPTVDSVAEGYARAWRFVPGELTRPRLVGVKTQMIQSPRRVQVQLFFKLMARDGKESGVFFWDVWERRGSGCFAF